MAGGTGRRRILSRRFRVGHLFWKGTEDSHLVQDCEIDWYSESVVVLGESLLKTHMNSGVDSRSSP